MKPTYEELKAKYGDEKVYVVHRSELEYLKEGFNPYDKDTYKKMITKSFPILRTSAEYNPKFRQVVPYIVLRHGKSLFATTRLKNSGEARLVDDITIAVGGHINPVDNMEPGNIISNCVIRELTEELKIQPNTQMNSKIIGFINDNSNEVSQDHVGAVVLIDVSIPNIKVRENDKLTGGFMNVEEIKKSYDKLESWSQIVFDVLYEEITTPKQNRLNK